MFHPLRDLSFGLIRFSWLVEFIKKTNFLDARAENVGMIHFQSGFTAEVLSGFATMVKGFEKCRLA